MPPSRVPRKRLDDALDFRPQASWGRLCSVDHDEARPMLCRSHGANVARLTWNARFPGKKGRKTPVSRIEQQFPKREAIGDKAPPVDTPVWPYAARGRSLDACLFTRNSIQSCAAAFTPTARYITGTSCPVTPICRYTRAFVRLIKLGA